MKIFIKKILKFLFDLLTCTFKHIKKYKIIVYPYQFKNGKVK